MARYTLGRCMMKILKHCLDVGSNLPLYLNPCFIYTASPFCGACEQYCAIFSSCTAPLFWRHRRRRAARRRQASDGRNHAEPVRKPVRHAACVRRTCAGGGKAAESDNHCAFMRGNGVVTGAPKRSEVGCPEQALLRLISATHMAEKEAYLPHTACHSPIRGHKTK